MLTVNASERGGPVGRGAGDARARIRAAAPERLPVPAAESSPLGGAEASPRRAWRSALSIALAAGAVVAIAAAVAILAKAHVGQALLEVAWKRAQARGDAPAPWPWADTRPVAKLVAPRQQAEQLMLAGATGRTLAWGPGIADGTAKPGEWGNAIVTAHRDTHFRFLADVAVGDDLVVERIDGLRVGYRIVATRIADASSLAIPREVDVPTLTLVTCWPFDAIAPGGPLRYVVVAEAPASASVRGPRQRMVSASPRTGSTP